MKFRLRNLIFDERQSANRNIDSLMIIKSSGIKNNELVVRPSAATSLKNFGVRKIQYRRAFRLLHGSSVESFLPNVIGGDHVIGKPGGHPFDHSEQAAGQRAVGALELAEIELGHQIMNIQDDPGSR